MKEHASNQPPRSQRSADALRAASKHLHYELWMFNTLAVAMASGVFGKGALHNAVVESFVMHARVLLDFLYAERPKENDVVAQDYFDDDSEWPQVRPEMAEILRTIRPRVGKEAAHLTYARVGVSEEEKQWQFTQIAREINSAFQVFLEHVPSRYLHEEWESSPFRSQSYTGSD